MRPEAARRAEDDSRRAEEAAAAASALASALASAASNIWARRGVDEPRQRTVRSAERESAFFARKPSIEYVTSPA